MEHLTLESAEPGDTSTAPRRIALISCSASKLDHPAPARSLYTSTLFRKSVAYAERHCDSWMILSGKHGLLHPDTIIEPYDERLTAEPKRLDGRTGPSPWGHNVARALQETFDIGKPRTVTFVVLAGGIYERNIRAITPQGQAEFPLTGMQIGQRLQWLTQQATLPSNAVHSDVA